MTKSGVGDYAGDKTAIEAFEMLKQDKSALLVDVRTRPEWAFVGAPDLSELGKDVLAVEWQEYPSMRVNPQFAGTLSELIAKAGGDAKTPILFLCRSGARSRAAAIAMTAAGHMHCYNVAGGFEGGHDDRRRRGALEGWKAGGLPWTQP
jgi:rhodanese-related sulfurtransferase